MAPAASLLGLPTELRLAIIQFTFEGAGRRTRLQTSEAIQLQRDDGATYWESQKDGRDCIQSQNCRTIARILRVNRQIHAEALPILYSKMEISCYLDTSGLEDGSEPRRCVFGRDAVAGDHKATLFDDRLHAWSSNIQRMSLQVELSTTIPLAEESALAFHLDYFKGQMLLEHMIRVMNGAQNLTEVLVHATWSERPVVPNGACCALKNISAFALLRGDIQLSMTVQDNGTNYYGMKNFTDEAMETIVAYIKALQTSPRNSSTTPTPLHHSRWAKLFTWVSKTLAVLLCKWYDDDVDRTFIYNGLSYSIQDLDTDVNVVLHEAWEAYRLGDEVEFQIAVADMRTRWGQCHRLLERALDAGGAGEAKSF